MNSFIKKISAFLALILFQALVLNNVNIGGFVNPYVFPLFILLFSFNTKTWQLLIYAFIIGLVIDLFNGTMGMHTFATVFMAFLRPLFLNNFKAQTEKNSYPSIKENSFSWILLYIFTMLFVHHSIYFIIEAGTLSNILDTLVLIFLSTLMSSFISILILFTFNSKK